MASIITLKVENSSMNKNLGVTVSWQGATVPSVRSLALAAEELGFEYLWVPEAWGLEATSTIAHLLTVTNSIKIGTGILNVYSRSAALIGMTCATLEQISPGRTLLGLGTSGKSLVENWHGVQFARSLQRTKEYVEVIRKVATGEKVEFEGELLRLARFRLYTKPCSPPPIFLGAIGEKNLKLAGRISEGAIVATYPISKLGHAARLVSEDGSKKLFAYYPFRITSSKEEETLAKSEVAENIAFYVASMGSYYAKNLVNLGFDQSVRKIADAHRLGGHRSAVSAVDESLVEELSLIGSLDVVAKKLAKMPENVVTVLGLRASSEEKASEGINSLKTLAKGS